MMMRLRILLTFLVCTYGKAYTQINPSAAADTTQPLPHFEKVLTISGSFTDIEVDALGNIYLLKDAQLTKYAANGDSVAVYSEVKRLGQPGRVDVSNPFKTLLYYPNFSTIVWLDNMLAERGQMNLRKSGIFLAGAVGTSYDNRVWVFDEQDFKLKKLDENGKQLLEGPDLRIAAQIAPHPQKLFDHEGTVYLYDSTLGFVLLDYYGALIQVLPFTGWKDVTVTNERLFGITASGLHQYGKKTFLEKTYPMPVHFHQARRMVMGNGLIYLLQQDGMEIYRLPQ